MANPRTLTRAPRALMLAVAAAFVVTLPASASADLFDPCLADPASCLEPVTEDPPVDPCLKDPASCLSDQPPQVDECLEDPARCLGEAPEPEVDECTVDATACVPEPPEVDGCVDTPERCLTDEVPDCTRDAGRCLDPDDGGDEGGEEDDDQGAAPPGARRPPGTRQSDPRPRAGNPPASAATAGGTAPPPNVAPVLVSDDSSGSESVIDRLRRGVIDAAERFAFPLAVAIAVAAFLLVQGRIDRRDPKLMAAPIDARDDVVSFR